MGIIDSNSEVLCSVDSFSLFGEERYKRISNSFQEFLVKIPNKKTGLQLREFKSSKFLYDNEEAFWLSKLQIDGERKD